jgi:hypothetical protein
VHSKLLDYIIDKMMENATWRSANGNIFSKVANKVKSLFSVNRVVFA